MKASLRTIVSSALLALLVVLVVATSFWAFRQIETAAEARKHSYTVIGLADALLAQLTDAETGQRGYALTGDEAFLKPYLAVRDGIRAQFEELRRLTEISSAQAHLDTVAVLTDAKLAELAQGISLRRANSKPQRTLLYVEDNPANLELVEQLIARRADLHLISAGDGELGVEFARLYQPQVILMDINLPGISGIEALQIMRADPSTAHIPVVAVSANALPNDIERALAAGFFRYLTKPIKVNEFMDTLDLALNFEKTPSARSTKEEKANV